MKPRRWLNKELKSLNPATDYARMVDLLMNWRDKNPFFHHLGYTLLFLRGVAIPDIARVVYNGGKGQMVRVTALRADETLHFTGKWYRNGPDSEETKKSIERINAIHSKFNIPNELNIYTIASFMLVPNRFRKNLGYTTPKWEKDALVNFWSRIGHLMHIEDMPKSWDKFSRFFDRYEKEKFAYSEEGMKCAEALVNEFVDRWFKNNPAKGLTFLYANFDNKLRKVFPLHYPNPFKSFLLRKYFGFVGKIKKMRRDDPIEPLYVEEAFRPQRSEKQKSSAS